MNLEKTQELYEFLKGETPEGFTLKTGQPNLSEDMAFTIIYVLQEKFHLIPDIYEMCYECKELYDTESDGHHFDDVGINLCDGCISQITRHRYYQDMEKFEVDVCDWWKKNRGLATSPSSEGTPINQSPKESAN